MKVSDLYVYCALDREQQALFLEGRPEACAQVALWFRKLIAPRYELFFYDQGFGDHLKLTRATTEQEILDRFG
jgi:hypothetical protein